MKINNLIIVFILLYSFAGFAQEKDSSQNGFKLKQLITREAENPAPDATDTKIFSAAPKISLLYPNTKKHITSHGVLQVSADFKNISGKGNVVLMKNAQILKIRPNESVSKNEIKLTWDIELSDGLNEFEFIARNNIKSERDKFSVTYVKPRNPKITLISPNDVVQTTAVSVFTVVAEIRNITDGNDVILKKGRYDKIPPIKQEKISDGYRMTWDLDLQSGQNDIEIIAKNFTLNTSSKFVITYKEPQFPKFKISVWAVIVGISKYKNANGGFQNLKYAANDAQLFYDYLKDTYGDYIEKNRVSLLINEKATRANFIRELKEKAKNADENDLIFVYFAGHGVAQTSSRVFFYCYDTEPDLVEATAVPNSDITSLLDITAANKKVLIADACHSGLISKDTRGISRINEFILDLSQKQGYYIFTSARGSEEAQEGEKWGSGHGVFTYHFVQGLRGKADNDRNKIITIEEIYDYVQKKVRDDTDGRQNPQLKENNIEGDFPISIIK